MRAQVSIEFMILVGFLLFFFVLFLGVLVNQSEDKYQEQDEALAYAIILQVRDELSLAAGASDGYQRNFSLPPNIYGRDYTITLDNGTIYLEAEGLGIATSGVSVGGEIFPGENSVKNVLGEVVLNA